MKRAVVFLIACALILTTCGCTPSDENAFSVKTVGILLPSSELARWSRDAEHLTSRFNEKNIAVDVQFAQESVEAQIAQIEQMVENRVNAIIITPVSSPSLGEPLKLCRDAGIPVIAYDRLITDTPYVDYYVTFNSFSAGAMQAMSLIQAFPAGGIHTLELVNGASDDSNTTLYYNGAMSVFQPLIDENALIVKSGQTSFYDIVTESWDPTLAAGRILGILGENYKQESLDMLWCASDALADCIISTLSEYGLALPKIAGQNADASAIKAIIAGTQHSTVFKDTRKLSRCVAELTQKIINNRNVSLSDTDGYYNGSITVPTQVIEPIVVDKDNYNALLIDDGYYTLSDIS